MLWDESWIIDFSTIKQGPFNSLHKTLIVALIVSTERLCMLELPKSNSEKSLKLHKRDITAKRV